jgi:IPTL-CTERM motif
MNAEVYLKGGIMKKLISSVMVLLLMTVFSIRANAAFGDLFIQVELNTPSQGCSILKVRPDGFLSQFISNAQILNLTGNATADCDDAGLAVGLDGKVYFNEDSSDNIFVATRNGQLGIFITDNVVDPLFPLTVDWDNGLAISPVTGNLVAADEDNEAIVEFPTNVPTPITDPALINILAVEADFEALLPPGATVDLEGGIAIDFQDNIYITNDGTSSDPPANVIFKLTPEGDLSILCTQAELAAATGSVNIDLDVGAVFGGNLYVADDGDCDCIIQIDPDTCDPEVIVTEEDITAVTGNTGADLEGGLCIDPDSNLFIGDDSSPGFGGDRPIILQSPFGDRSNVSIFASDGDIDAFYAVLEPGSDPQLRGSCSVEGAFDNRSQIPTLSEWGLIAMALALGIIGFVVMRKRAVKA